MQCNKCGNTIKFGLDYCSKCKTKVVLTQMMDMSEIKRTYTSETEQYKRQSAVIIKQENGGGAAAPLNPKKSRSTIIMVMGIVIAVLIIIIGVLIALLVGEEDHVELYKKARYKEPSPISEGMATDSMVKFTDDLKDIVGNVVDEEEQTENNTITEGMLELPEDLKEIVDEMTHNGE